MMYFRTGLGTKNCYLFLMTWDQILIFRIEQNLHSKPRARILWGCPEDFHSVNLSERSNEDFPNEVSSDSVPKPLDPVHPLKTWGHLPQRLCFHSLQYTPIPNHALWFTWCYQRFFLPVLWKSGRHSSWLINLKPCSKWRSFLLILYFYSCFVFLGGLFSPSSVYCKLYCKLSFILYNSLIFFQWDCWSQKPFLFFCMLPFFFFPPPPLIWHKVTFDFAFFFWTDGMPAPEATKTSSCFL